MSRHPGPALATFAFVSACCLLAAPDLAAQDVTTILEVEAQPLKAQVRRIADALEFLGKPLQPAEKAALRRAYESADPIESVALIQEVLDAHVLVGVNINPESRVKAGPGPAAPELLEQGWRMFLIKVHNEAGVTAELGVFSPQAEPLYKPSTGAAEPTSRVTAAEIEDRWLDLHLFNRQPMQRRLSGLAVEYRIIELHSRDVGQREATFGFHVGQGTQDLGFRSDVSILFRCLPSVNLEFDVRDVDGESVMASFEIRDPAGRVYPSPAKRLAPDFFFHPQVYRTTGETVRLPAGRYDIAVRRGPEYRVLRKSIEVPSGVESHREVFQLERWIHPKASGWYSGDHHVHGGGCAHYESPTAGVEPKDMFRHQLGEDLNVACVLSWGPCWYFQKQFFDGKVHPLSRPDYLMRYDVEVSGFPSQHAGHLCLLRLKEDDFPGTERIEDWPSWDLPILQWGKAQGGVVGFSHSGWGLSVPTDKLPNYIIPPFDGIGANEYIVDVVHDAVDFISTVDTPYVWELNIWYHTLNCGFRTRISGETDFPCIFGQRVGIGRIYCKMPGGLDFDGFCDALRNGRSYVSDGFSHLMDFAVGGIEVGTQGSELHLAGAGTVTVTARVAALLGGKPDERIANAPYWEQPYWHVERARVDDTNLVPVEVIVNGYPIATELIEGDGELRTVSFEVPVEFSSWIALRILPSSHTNPVFVHVDGKPIRASRRSARWCIDSVDRCWASKLGGTRPAEQAAAREAYDVAKAAYEKILTECVAD